MIITLLERLPKKIIVTKQWNNNSHSQPHGEQQLLGYIDSKSNEEEDEQLIIDKENEIDVVLMLE